MADYPPQYVAGGVTMLPLPAYEDYIVPFPPPYVEPVHIPPAVSNIDPPAGTLLYASTHISFDITDEDSPFRRIILTMLFEGSDAAEVVYDGTEFSNAYTGSTKIAITNGFHFDLIRAGGWPAAPTFIPYAIDTTGQENP